MIIFKILQWFLVPSGFIFVFLVVGLILIFRKKRKLKKIGKIFLAVGVTLFYLFSITPIADLILTPLENMYQPIGIEDLDKANTIVLLLGGKESDVLRASEVLRIYNLKQMIYNLQPTVIISGDDPLGTQKEEANNLKMYLIERGIPSENIILEDQSRNTKESAENIKKMIGKEPFFLVTSAYHMP
ncbi:MAG TPA: YdcF family protein, partial [Candidatus Pacearchaeota archaeon]|nr:YdcF family protein [Candidatus Pacearchaeota archaeon]